MKVKRGKDVYEVLKNGKPLVGARADMEAFLVFLPSYFRYVAVASFPLSLGPEAKDCLRHHARPLLLDRRHHRVDVRLVRRERHRPPFIRWDEGGKDKPPKKLRSKHELRRKVVRTRLAKRVPKRAPGCRGPGSARK